MIDPFTLVDALLRGEIPAGCKVIRYPMPACASYADVGHWTCPKVSRITYNGRNTIVFFNDNTKVIVECSDGDKYDRQTALAYAMVKRMLGKVKPDGTVDGNGFGCYMKKLVDAGFDQDKEKAEAKARKANAKAAHEAKQKAEQEAAYLRKVEKRAKELKLERDAAEYMVDKLMKPASKKFIFEGTEKPISVKPPKDVSNTASEKPYVRPNKPFSKFTTNEKREYWKNQYQLRKGKKNS